MVRTLVTGAAGTLGSALRPRLRDAGHSVRATSRSPPLDAATDAEWVELDLADGTGIDAAVDDVDVVVHAASNATGDSETVDVRGTERLLDAAADAGVEHVVYPSIVGIDDVPYSYYQHKLAAEGLVEDAPVPSTIVRATQFHQFLDELLGLVSRLPVWPLPTRFRSQPVDARAVADELVEHATGDPVGRAPNVCGPEVLTGREIASAYRDARGLRRAVVRLPIPGAAARAFRDGRVTCDGPTPDRTTWREWLAETYERTRTDAPEAASSR